LKAEARGKRAGSKLVLAPGVEDLVGAAVIGFRHEDLGGAAQIAVVRRRGVRERLRGTMPCFSSIITNILALTTGPV
jgi:hypothetical protein